MVAKRAPAGFVHPLEFLKDCANRLRAGAKGIGQPHDKWKTNLALEHLADVFCAQRLNEIEHTSCGYSIPGDFVLINPDLQNRLARHLFDVDVGRAGNRFQDTFNLQGLFHQHVEIVAVKMAATSERTPEIISFIRISMGCVIDKPLPRQVAEFFLRLARVSSA